MDPLPIMEAVEEFNVSRSTLQRYISQKRLSRISSRNRFDRKVYVDRDELTKLFRTESGFVVDKTGNPDAPVAAKNPGGRPLGSGKRQKKSR